MGAKTNRRSQTRLGEPTMTVNRAKARLLALPLLTVLVGASLAPHEAHAQAAVAVAADPINTLDRAIQTAKMIQTTIQGVKDTVSGVVNGLTDSLRLSTGQQTVNSRAQIQAQSQMMDTWDARETQRRIVDWRMRGTMASVAGSSACNVITGSVAARNSFASVSRWREEMGAQQVDFNLGASPGTASRRGAAPAEEQRNTIHCQVAATQYDVDTGLCPAVTQEPQVMETGDQLRHPVGRDLNANTLIAPANLTMSPAERLAANAFLLHAFNSNPIGAMPNGMAGTPGGRHQAAMNNSAAALASVPQSVAATIAANNNAMPGTGGASGTPTSGAVGGGNSTVTGTGGATGAAGSTGIADWAEGTARQTIGYKSDGGNFPNGVSRNAYLRLRSMAWFWNPNWAQAVNAQGSDATMKDLVLIEAWRAYMDWENNSQLQQLNLSVAAIASTIEARTRPRAE